jgi:hypothetical protein
VEPSYAGIRTRNEKVRDVRVTITLGLAHVCSFSHILSAYRLDLTEEGGEQSGRP